MGDVRKMAEQEASRGFPHANTNQQDTNQLRLWEIRLPVQMFTHPKASTKSATSKLVGNMWPSIARVPIPGSAPHNQRETHNSQLFPGEGETEDSITDEKFRLLMGLPQELNMPGAACLNQSTDKKRNQVRVTENKGLDEDPIIHHYSSPGSKQEECPPLSFSLGKNMHPCFQQAA